MVCDTDDSTDINTVFMGVKLGICHPTWCSVSTPQSCRAAYRNV